MFYRLLRLALIGLINWTVVADDKLRRLNMSMADFVDDLLNRRGYDRRIRPGVDTGKPVMVHIDIFIMSISSIDDFNMDYSLNLYLRQTWSDDRLKFDNLLNSSVTLNYDQISQLWIPDTFFRNLKKGMFHDITVPNRLIRLAPDGTILFSQRLSLTFDCTMYLEKYPFDNQTCEILIGSYGYTTDDMDLIWRDKEKPVDYKRDLQLPEFTIQGARTFDCTANFSTGSFACIYSHIYFKRRYEYHLIQTYVPSTLIVMLSWVSFWIDTDAVPARISLGLLSVLTITTMASGTAARLPKVSYIKALDAWMVACLIFVFGALIEYSAVNVLSRRTKHIMSKKLKKQLQLQEQNSDLDHNTPQWVNNMNMYQAGTSMGMMQGNKVQHRVSHVSNEEDDMQNDHTNNVPQSVETRTPNDRQTPTDTRPPVMDMRTTAMGTGTRTEAIKMLDQKPAKRKCYVWKICENKALLVDLISRLFFPFSFGVFNVFYWGTYTFDVDSMTET